jgi:hypothetical protein
MHCNLQRPIPIILYKCVCAWLFMEWPRTDCCCFMPLCDHSLIQDQLSPAVAGAFPDAAQFVLSAQQLTASSITPEVAASLRSVLVYGADLHAFDALTTLIQAGVNAGKYKQQALRPLLGPVCLPQPAADFAMSCL